MSWIVKDRYNEMTEVEMEQLERLLGKLCLRLGNPICVAYPVLHDGYTVGVYEHGSGKLISDVTAPFIKDAVDKLTKNIKQ